MPDKIVAVRTAGPNFSTPAIRLFRAEWINTGDAGSPVRPAFFDYVAGHFARLHDSYSPWHRARIVAALKRHPECH